MRVVILTEGDKRRGFGHVARCLAFYQVFEAMGAGPEFIVDGDAALNDLLGGRRYTLKRWQKQGSEIADYVRGADIALLDSYEAGVEIYEKISELAKVPVYLDDTKRLDYPRGIIINGAIFAEGTDYQRGEGRIYLLGSDYAPLRQEFRDVPAREIREDIDCVMITFGGDDAGNLSPKVLKLLNEHYPDIVKTVIVGKGFQNYDEIVSLKDTNTQLICSPGAEEMKNCMLAADLAISAGGQTLYELARTGVPTIAIAVAENQLNNVRGLERAGFVEYAGYVGENKTINSIAARIERLRGRDMRLARSMAGKRLVDGKGTTRAVGKIVDLYMTKWQKQV